MVEVEVANRSGVTVDEQAAVAIARRVLAAEGIDEGELGLVFVEPEEGRRLKREHLGVDETPEVLAFPIDERDDVPEGVPRQLGDVVLTPVIAGDEWEHRLIHGVLHLLGYDHGAEMEEREAELGT
jgi:probable rRNA maturation factor